MGIVEIFILVGFFGYGTATAWNYNRHMPAPVLRTLEPASPVTATKP